MAKSWNGSKTIPMRNALLIVGSVAVLGLIAAFQVSPRYFQASAENTSALRVADANVAEQSRVTLKVSGIYCASCPHMVKKALSSETGVTNVELRATDDPGTLIAVVISERGLVTAESLAKTTADMGYPTEVIEDGQG